MTLTQPRILIVDDEVAQMRALRDTLASEGFTTVGVPSGREALELLSASAYDLLLTDLMMPGMDGVELLRGALAVQPELVAIVMTGQGTIDSAVQAMKAGALDYIQKPFRLNVILPVLSRALAVRDLRLANAELEKRVRDRTADLEAANRDLEIANKDLEAFAYSVSHDLRAPLRAISGFLEIYMSDHGASITPEGRRLLDVVVQSTVRMNQLIDDLLQFSRLSRQPLRKRLVPMQAIVQRLTDDILAREADRHIDIAVREVPDCWGDPSLLEQVMVNLLSNAFKFSRDRDPARIEIGSRTDDGENVYFIKDNGAGFDMKYAGRLFSVFARLHSATDFEGTGVGLSIVHRIVTRHGGRIWAESEPGRGTTMYFSLPSS